MAAQDSLIHVGGRRLASVALSHRRATIAQTSENVDGGSDRKV